MSMSPTVYATKSLKFRIYFKDHNPPHVHVAGSGAEAVFKLETCECLENNGFSRRAIHRIAEMIQHKRALFLET